MEYNRILGALEAVLFASGEPITIQQLADALCVETTQVYTTLEDLEKKYNENEERGLMLRHVNEGVQLVTKPEYFEATSRMEKHREIKLSNAAMETLAIIAFKQPVTRAEMEQIRGVKVDGVVNTLLDLGLIDEAGHKKTIGNPLLYKTTDKFLTTFGLNSLADLPNPEDEDVMLEALGGEQQLALEMDGVEMPQRQNLLTIVKENIENIEQTENTDDTGNTENTDSNEGRDE